MRPEVVTVGVVVTVPDPWGAELQEERAAFGDRLAWTIPTHITLLPPTQVPESRLAAVDAHLARVASTRLPFTIALHGSGTFRPVTQTSFVTVAEGGQICAALAGEVRTGPLRRQLPFPYHPHVTMAVDLDDQQHERAEQAMAGYRLAFEVTELDRYELAEHGVWEPAASFPLAAGGAGA